MCCDGIIWGGKPLVRRRTDRVSGGVSPRNILRFLSTTDHPPLYFFLEHYCRVFFGNSEFALRLLSALFGTASLPVFYLLAKKILNDSMAVALANNFPFSNVNCSLDRALGLLEPYRPLRDVLQPSEIRDCHSQELDPHTFCVRSPHDSSTARSGAACERNLKLASHRHVVDRVDEAAVKADSAHRTGQANT